MSEIKKILRSMISEAVELTQEIDTIKDDTELETAGMNSIGFINLIITIEDYFSINISFDKFVISMADTINKLENIIETEKRNI